MPSHSFQAVREGNAQACTALLTSLLKQQPIYHNLGVARANGDLFCSVLPFTQPVNVTNSSWFHRAVQRRDFSLGTIQESLVNREFIVASGGYPVFDATNRLQAVIAASLDLGRLNQLATRVQLPRGTTLTAIDRNGIILARYPDPQWIGQVLPESPLVKIILTQGEGTAEVEGADGVQRLYAFTQVREAQGRALRQHWHPHGRGVCRRSPTPLA